MVKGDSLDRVVIYDMKEDPSIRQFVGSPAPKGFYGLEIDEDRRQGAVIYRVGESFYRVDFDLKVKNQQLILKNGKRQKVLVRETKVTPSGGTEEIVYPVECPAEKSGWRYGASFGRHLVRVNDDEGKRIIVGNIQLEYNSALQRCGDMGEDCGPVGCDIALVKTSSSTSNKPVAPAVAVSSSTAAKVSFSKALLEAKLSNQEILAAYKDDIEAVLPATVNNLTATTTGYRTTAYPFPGMTDPFIEQRGLKIGIIFKQYTSPDKAEPVEVAIEPLLPEFQAPLPNKCGTWESGPNKTLFDVKGRPAMYIQTPATGNSKVSSSLDVCGQTVSVAIQTQNYLSKEDLNTLLDAFPWDRMEQLIGSGK